MVNSKDSSITRFLGRSVLCLVICVASYLIFISIPSTILSVSPSSPVLASDHDHRELASTSHSLFGIITRLDASVGTISVILVVAAVLCVEYLFHILHELTFDTPFEHLVPTVEKELMIVGFTAFLFKVVVTIAQGIDPKWYDALEYADILVPLFSFSYCALGLALIAFSAHQCAVWSRAYHMKLLELLDELFDVTDSWVGALSWKTSRTLTEVEFRIFHNIFCDSFKIQRKAFAFNEYVEKVADTFVQNLITIRLVDWLLLCILVVLNLGRAKLGLVLHQCANDDFSCQDRSSTMLLTICGAVIFVVTSMVAVVSRRVKRNIMTVKGVPPTDCWHHYLEHMEEKQDATQQHVRMDGAALRSAVAQTKGLGKVGHPRRPRIIPHNNKRAELLARKLSAKMPEFGGSRVPSIARITDLRGLDYLSEGQPFSPPSRSPRAATVMHAAHICGADGGTNSYRSDPSTARGGAGSAVLSSISGDFAATGKHNKAAVFSSAVEDFRPAPPGDLATIVHGDAALAAAAHDGDMVVTDVLGGSHRASPIHPELVAPAPSVEYESRDEQQDEALSAALSLIRGNDAPPADEAHAGPASPSFDDIEASLLLMHGEGAYPPRRTRRKSILKSFIHNANRPVYNLDDHSHDKEIDSTFPFQQPALYFEVVRGLMMFLALYWGLFLSNFLAAAGGASSTVLCAAPIMLSSAMYIYVVTHASLLMAVHSIDSNAVLEVLEQTEGSRALGEEIREKLLCRLRELGEPQAELYNLFHEIDDSGSGNLTREEFAIFMNAIDIHFSRKKWQQIFREIDLNCDERIAFQELFLFLFPDHDVGLALERKRMKILGHRVKMKARKRLETSSKSRSLAYGSSKKTQTNPSLVVPVDCDLSTGGPQEPPSPGERRVNNIALGDMRRLTAAQVPSVNVALPKSRLSQIMQSVSPSSGSSRGSSSRSATSKR